MAKRVKDILVDVGSGDLLLSSKKSKSISYRDVIWGALFDGDDENTLYANIYIPPYVELKKDELDRYKLYFRTSYKPDSKQFTIRLVTKRDGDYVPISQSECAFPVESVSCVGNSNSVALYASELFSVNLEGFYVANMVFVNGGQNISYIYSAGNKDFEIGMSDDQSAQFLSLCGPGKYYRYPLTGVDITKYVNSVVSHSDLSKRIVDEFEKDGIDAQNIGFDSSTGKIDVQFKHEESIAEQIALVGVNNLDYDAIDVTDSMLAEVSEYINLRELDTDYDGLIIDSIIPDNKIKSCFANGMWIGEYPWTGEYYWRGEE